MKKQYLIIVTIVALFAGLVSCNNDFLEVQPEGQPTFNNFFNNETEATQALIGVYDIVRKNSGGFENMITMFNAGADDLLAGGGGASDGIGIHSFDDYTIDSNTMPRSFWSDYYKGIARANIFLDRIDVVPMSDATKLRMKAEARTLRAYYYFELVRMFKNIPLITEPLDQGVESLFNVEQATSEAVYTFIETELTEAINDLPTTVGDEVGRLKKGTAQAILGKVFLFNGKNSQAAQMFAAVNGNNPGVGPAHAGPYGNYLLENFSSLWIPANKFNAESVFEVSHSSQKSGWGNWGSGSDEGNTVCVMVGPRNYQKITNNAPSLPSGWSFNVFTQEFYNLMQGDPRFGATIFDLKTLKQNGDADYFAGYDDTGYFMKKFLPTTADVYTEGGDAVLNYAINTYIIRLADTYLMEAEALGGTGARAQALLDAVRSRSGLPSTPVSLQAIKAERRKELAGEGHRWFDLVRWGDAPTVLGPSGFVAGKNEILPIPNQELQNTLLHQNPNYN